MKYKLMLIILILAAAVLACQIDPCLGNVCTSTVNEHVTLVAERTATAYEATAQAGATAWAVQQTAISTEESEK